MEDLISILLPAYNTEKYVSLAIKSILDQTHKNIELLVADDGSSDNTRDIIDSIQDKRISRYHQSKNIGKTRLTSILYAASKGSFITIHDADDVSHNNRLERQLLEFAKNPSLGMCGTSFLTINSDGTEVLEQTIMAQTYEAVLSGLDQCSQFHGPTMLIRRDVIESLGQIYRPYFRDYNEDSDLAYRISQRYICYNLSDILYQYRILNGSLSKKPESVRRRYLYKVVVHLAEQRAARGYDSLDIDDTAELDDFVKSLIATYLEEPALVFRESAAYYMYLKFYSDALREALLSIATSPAQFINYRTLAYCLRETLKAKLVR